MPGNISKRGKCEYTYVFVNNVILLLIELKFNLTIYNMSEWSDIVAQVCCEADGILFSFYYPLILDLDRAPIQVISHRLIMDRVGG
jgi:hypothetical protein